MISLGRSTSQSRFFPYRSARPLLRSGINAPSWSYATSPSLAPYYISFLGAGSRSFVMILLSGISRLAAWPSRFSQLGRSHFSSWSYSAPTISMLCHALSPFCYASSPLDLEGERRGAISRAQTTISWGLVVRGGPKGYLFGRFRERSRYRHLPGGCSKPA